MKKALILLLLAGLSMTAIAQHNAQSGKNPSMWVQSTPQVRTEIIIPDVNGLKVIKADLHVHTYFSDGVVSPSFRVSEAWMDGLDALAITDHIEYRPHEKEMLRFLGDGASANKVEKDKIPSNLNVPVELATQSAKKYPLTIIPGAEITRNPQKAGHFNALFTTDNNSINDPDPLQAIRNAKNQGAIVQINHPGWRRTSNEFTDIERAAISEKLISGVEVFNDAEFYPDVIERALDEKLYICSGSDIHDVSANKFAKFGVFREMTLILSKDSSLESIRDGLENQRTIAYAYGDLAGGEDLLKALFLASVEVKILSVDKKGGCRFQLTNKSSLPYRLTLPGQITEITLGAFSSIISSCSKQVISVSVNNMWCGAGKHPSIEL